MERAVGTRAATAAGPALAPEPATDAGGLLSLHSGAGCCVLAASGVHMGYSVDAVVEVDQDPAIGECQRADAG